MKEKTSTSGTEAPSGSSAFQDSAQQSSAYEERENVSQQKVKEKERDKDMNSDGYDLCQEDNGEHLDESKLLPRAARTKSAVGNSKTATDKNEMDAAFLQESATTSASAKAIHPFDSLQQNMAKLDLVLPKKLIAGFFLLLVISAILLKALTTPETSFLMDIATSLLQLVLISCCFICLLVTSFLIYFLLLFGDYNFHYSH